jgi:hypothetical protein
MLLTSELHPVTLFPRTFEICHSASEIELKGFCSMRLKRKTYVSETGLMPVDPESIDKNADYSTQIFQDMDVFVW